MEHWHQHQLISNEHERYWLLMAGWLTDCLAHRCADGWCCQTTSHKLLLLRQLSVVEAEEDEFVCVCFLPGYT